MGRGPAGRGGRLAHRHACGACSTSTLTDATWRWCPRSPRGALACGVCGRVATRRPSPLSASACGASTRWQPHLSSSPSEMRTLRASRSGPTLLISSPVTLFGTSRSTADASTICTSRASSGWWKTSAGRMKPLTVIGGEKNETDKLITE
jgi:hypothetical protein